MAATFERSVRSAASSSASEMAGKKGANWEGGFSGTADSDTNTQKQLDREPGDLSKHPPLFSDQPRMPSVLILMQVRTLGKYCVPENWRPKTYRVGS